jgi:hypothetical protein
MAGPSAAAPPLPDGALDALWPQYGSLKPFALSLSKGLVACLQGFDMLSPNGVGA